MKLTLNFDARRMLNLIFRPNPIFFKNTDPAPQLSGSNKRSDQAETPRQRKLYDQASRMTQGMKKTSMKMKCSQIAIKVTRKKEYKERKNERHEMPFQKAQE